MAAAAEEEEEEEEEKQKEEEEKLQTSDGGLRGSKRGGFVMVLRGFVLRRSCLVGRTHLM